MTVRAGDVWLQTRVLLVTVRSSEGGVQYLGHEYVISDVSSAHRYDVIACTQTRFYAQPGILCCTCWLNRQESLASAKVSARQPWYIGRNLRPPLRIAQQYQRNLCIVEKYFQCTTIPSLTVRVYLHSFSRCCLPNMPTSAKFQENLNLQQF